MSFVFPQYTDLLKHTTEKGQLLSVSDTTAQHTIGTKYYDDKTNKTYVYAYNGTGAVLVADTPLLLVSNPDTASDIFWEVVAIADDSASKSKYACLPAAAIPTTGYGWVQVQGAGTIATDAFVTNEAWAVGDELYVINALIATLADNALGVANHTFGFAQSSHASNHTNATHTADIYIVGREVIAST